MNQQNTPPGGNPATWKGRNWRCSGLEGVGALPVFSLEGRNGEAHLLSDRTGQEAAN